MNIAAAAKGATRSKTMYFAAALAILGVLELNLDLLAGIFGENSAGTITLVIAVLTAALRIVTHESLEEKADG